MLGLLPECHDGVICFPVVVAECWIVPFVTFRCQLDSMTFLKAYDKPLATDAHRKQPPAIALSPLMAPPIDSIIP